MATKKDAFFDATQDALDKLTEMYDLVWPIDVSLRYMRKTVTNFTMQSSYDLRPDDYVAEFDPDHRTHGVNYRQAFVYTGRNIAEQDENERKLEAKQQENLAWLLLSNTIPIYERWWKQLAEEVGFADISEEGMEFPSDPGHSNKKGILQQLAELTQSESTVFKTVFYDLYSNKRNHCSSLGELNLSMYAFRLFKEIRNCYMHNGGIVSNKIVDRNTGNPWITVAYDAYKDHVVSASTSTQNVLGIEELPLLPADFCTSVGSKLRITLRGIVGFSNIMRRIMLTVDSELIKSIVTEQYYLDRWRALHATHTERFKMSVNTDTVVYMKKVFTGQAISQDECEAAERSFNRRLSKAIQQFEYDSMAYLLMSTRLLMPSEMKRHTVSPDATSSAFTLAVNQYPSKLLNHMIPFLKAHSLISSPTP